MSETATTNPPIDERVLDELVPPTGPRLRRALLWVAFLGIVGASTWAFTSGTVTPRASIVVDSSSGKAPFGVTTSVRNNSWVTIEVTGGPRPRPGLSSVGYTTGSPTADYLPPKHPAMPFPLRIAPHETVVITSWYRLTDCRAIEGIRHDDDVVDLQLRIADGPASWITVERTSERSPIGWSMDHPQIQVSWAAGIAERACQS